jgi:hypothetical protein
MRNIRNHVDLCSNINIPHFHDQLNFYVYNGNGSVSWWLSNNFHRSECILVIWEFQNTCKARVEVWRLGNSKIKIIVLLFYVYFCIMILYVQIFLLEVLILKSNCFYYVLYIMTLYGKITCLKYKAETILCFYEFVGWNMYLL